MWTIESSKKISQSVHDTIHAAMNRFLGREDLGFLSSQACRLSLRDIEDHSSFFENKKKMAVIGLGGSSLGTKALCEALFPYEWQKKLTFLDNVDSHSVDFFLNSIQEVDDWGWIVCSKSGGTIEVTSLYDYCSTFFQEKQDYSISQNTLCITEEKQSLLFDFAQQAGCPVLTMPNNIGGRFSAFTNIGLFPLSFLQPNLEKVLEGYESGLKDRENLLSMVASRWLAFETGDVSFYSFQYSDRLQSWGLWLQQLWSESLSKKATRAGASATPLQTFVPCRGASDQHSVLQQVIEGVEKKSTCFHLVGSSFQGQVKIGESSFQGSLMNEKSIGHLLEVEALSTIQAVQEVGNPTLVLRCDELDEASVSHLMVLWMLTIGVLGELMDINAFDQPGVESGKRIARRVLSQA